MGQKLKNINPDAEFLYETLANSIDGYIYLWDIKTDQYRVSEKMVEDFGFECIYPENFSEFWLSLIHERDAGRIQKVASRFIPSGKKKFNLEYQIQTVSGSYLWVGSKIDIKYDDESQTPLWGIGVIKNKALDQTIPPEVEIKRETPIEETETQRFTRKLKAILDAKSLTTKRTS
ncbi:MAG: PAS domain-containing protein, partial [Eubacterium sp.]